MAAMIELPGGHVATVAGGEWLCDDPLLLPLLNHLKPLDGPSGADPNPDLTLARAAVKRLGGHVVSFDPTEHVPGRVY